MAADFRKAFDDIVECPICMERMSDTRMLPCIHTFCRECLENHVQDSGRVIKCPCCRNESEIPKGGIEKLPKNIFIEKLLDLNESSQSSQINKSGVVCRYNRHNDAVDKDIGCIGYCVECVQYLCRSCSKSHARKTKSHRVLPTGCLDHADKQLEFFCKTCKLSICSQCSSTNHKTHEFCSFNEYANFVEKTLESVKSKKDKEIKALKVTASNVELLEREVKALKKKVSQLHFIGNQFAESLKEKSSEADKLRGKLERIKSENSEVTQKLVMNKNCEIMELRKQIEDLEKQKSLSTANPYCTFGSIGDGSCRGMIPHEFKLSCRTCGREVCLHCFTKSLKRENTGPDFVLFFVFLVLLFLAYKYFF